MRSIPALIIMLLCLAAKPVQHDNPSFRRVKNTAFKEGEVLNYRMHYGFVNAGVVRIEVGKTNRRIKGRELLHIVGTGRSVSAFDWFFKVRDRYESYIDKEGLFPWLFIRRVHEGGFEIEQDYTFDRHNNTVTTQKDQTHEVPSDIQDMISAFFYARTIDVRSLDVGDTISVPLFMDDEVWPLSCQYLGKGKAKVDAGKFRCLKFAPVVQQGRVFKNKNELVVYITDDRNHIPVLAKANILVGSIKMELTDYKGLSNPLSKVDK